MKKVASIIVSNEMAKLTGHAALENPNINSPSIVDGNILISGWVFDWKFKDDARIIVEDGIGRRQHELSLHRPDLLRVFPRATWKTGFYFHYALESSVNYMRLSIKQGISFVPWCVIAFADDASS